MAASGETTLESRMLVDGELVHAASGRSFRNVNPATEEVLGTVAEADAGDMHRAIDAARRAFDETDWSGFIGPNGGAGYFPDVPFGGYKESGVGRQNGIAGFEQYLEVKPVAWPVG